MVHALEEIRRVLVSDGILIDLRPLSDNWRVEVASLREVKRTGRVTDLPESINADAASNAAMKEAEAQGWFKREQEELFPYYYSWDMPSEMEEFIDDDWKDVVALDDETKRATRSAWAVGDGDSRVRVRVDMLIARWKKQP